MFEYLQIFAYVYTFIFRYLSVRGYRNLGVTGLSPSEVTASLRSFRLLFTVFVDNQ